MKNKLAQKASGVQNEETVLLRAFKYFDLNNNNTVEPEEFAKAIEKIGIMIPTRQVRRGLELGSAGEGRESLIQKERMFLPAFANRYLINYII